MDWTSSGIEHEWRFQLVDGVSFSPIGWLGNVKGGSITEGWRTDLRSSCTLDLDGRDIPLSAAVRVWHFARLGTEEYSELVGTFFPDPWGGTYEYGRMSGDVQLYSALCKLSNARWKGVGKMGKGANVIAKFKEIAGWCHATPWITPSWNTSKKFAETWVWVYPTDSALVGAQRCADAMGGYLGADEQGRVTLTPYTAPSKMGKTWAITPGGIALVGVDVNVPDLVNSVTAKHESGGKTYTASASVVSTHPWAEGRIGRLEAKELSSVTIQEGSSIQTQLNNAVKRELNSVSDMRRTFTLDALYDPSVKCGTAGSFTYRDSDADEGISCKAVCSSREIQLDHTAQMSLTLEEL